MKTKKPLEKQKEEPIEVNDVASYINKINSLIGNETDSKKIYVYRGESQYRDSFCTPNIFRKNVLNESVNYERSLFNAMRQNKLTTKESFLENAIDAQHGEFPSRLLDVTYNCLNALYFAVAPSYHKNIKINDDKDGMVYVICIDEIYSPSAENIKDCYNAIINKDKKWFSGQFIFDKNHKFIDHSKVNNRIIAQQGAFILFQGEDAEKLPTYMVQGFNIPAKSKEKIRKELSVLFGINKGSIYPEIFNLVDEITEKSKSLVTEKFCWQNELKSVMNNLQKELDVYLQDIYLANIDSSKSYSSIFSVENVINSYRVGLLKFYNDFMSFYSKDVLYLDKKVEDDDLKYLDKIIKEYNQKIKKFSEEIKFISKDKLGISKSLIIGEDKDVLGG